VIVLLRTVKLAGVNAVATPPPASVVVLLPAPGAADDDVAVTDHYGIEDDALVAGEDAAAQVPTTALPLVMDMPLIADVNRREIAEVQTRAGSP